MSKRTKKGSKSGVNSPKKSPRVMPFLLLFIGFLIVVFLGGLGIIRSNQSKSLSTPTVNLAITPPSWLTVQLGKDFPQNRIAEAIQAAIEYKDRFGCPRDIRFVPFKTETETGPDGKPIYTIEEAGPGWMALDNINLLRNTVLHAMTHACKPDTVWLTTPIKVYNFTVTGFEGLNMKVTLDTGRQTAMTFMEEGVAEAVALQFPGYIIQDAGYKNFYEITAKYFGDLPIEQVLKYVWTADGFGFMGKILGKPKDQITVDEINGVVDLYNRANNKR